MAYSQSQRDMSLTELVTPITQKQIGLVHIHMGSRAVATRGPYLTAGQLAS